MSKERSTISLEWPRNPATGTFRHDEGFGFIRWRSIVVEMGDFTRAKRWRRDKHGVRRHYALIGAACLTVAGTQVARLLQANVPTEKAPGAATECASDRSR